MLGQVNRSKSRALRKIQVRALRLRRKFPKKLLAALSILTLASLAAFQNCSTSGFKAMSCSGQTEAVASPPPQNADGSHAYAWVGTAWSTCSAICGGGSQ